MTILISQSFWFKHFKNPFLYFNVGVLVKIGAFF